MAHHPKAKHMSTTTQLEHPEPQAECRWCKRKLRGKPYYMGGSAFIPETGEQAKVNHYGGFVCSQRCDYNASLDLEQSMPGHDWRQKTLGTFAAQAHRKNWNY